MSLSLGLGGGSQAREDEAQEAGPLARHGEAVTESRVRRGAKVDTKVLLWVVKRADIFP